MVHPNERTTDPPKKGDYFMSFGPDRFADK